MLDLSKISIGIKTFLRDQHLFACIAGIQANLPECKIIIADDGEHTEEKDGVYGDLEKEGHQVIICPFDSGFGFKSNHIAEVLKTPYLLIGSDDFDFKPKEVRQGIEEMLVVLENNPDIHIASGRVNNRAYEFHLLDNGDTIIEVPVRTDINEPYLWFRKVDLTVNYSLIRQEVFQKVKWDDDVKIGGGEHGSYFLDCKRAEFKVVWVRDVNINELQIPNSDRYREFRKRANSPERPCFRKRGIRKYVLGSGQVDYQEK